MKYVKFHIIVNPSIEYRQFVLFTDEIIHADVAESARYAFKAQWPKCFTKTMSAGFVHIEGGKYVCSGKSESLGTESDPKDSHWLNMGEHAKLVQEWD